MLTKRLMQQAIADRIAGKATKIDVAQLIEPWSTCWRALEHAEPNKSPEALYQALSSYPDRATIIGNILGMQPSDAAIPYPSAAELDETLPPLTWLWPDWIPRGMLSMVGGLGSAGKSFTLLDIARRIIHGLPFPDGSPVPCPRANVLYVDAEGVPQLNIKRGKSWNMDLSRLYFMLPEGNDYMVDMEKDSTRDRLIEMIVSLEPAWVIIDSLSGVQKKGDNAIEDVRDVLGFLNSVAKDYQIGMTLCHHIVKQQSLNGLNPLFLPVNQNSLRGSAHIVNACRCVWGLWGIRTGSNTADARNCPRCLKVVKANEREPEPLGFTFEPCPPDSVKLQWGEVAETYHEPTKGNECAEWLEATLRNEKTPLRPQEIIEMGKLEGYNERMIYRARKKLEGVICDTENSRHPNNAWKLCTPANSDTLTL